MSLENIFFEWELGPDSQNPAGNGVVILFRDIGYGLNFVNPVNGTLNSGAPSLIDPTLFAPGSSGVNEAFGIGGSISANTTLANINNITATGPLKVPGPLPLFGVAAAFAHSRQSRRTVNRSKAVSHH